MERELTLEQVLQIEMEIQTQIHNFCQENGLRYYLWGGSLLGAVRHDGFIPWDDDMDIIMPRRDFEFFAKHFDSQRYGVVSCETDEGYPYVHAKAFDKKTRKVEHALSSNIPQKTGIDVDIFILDDSDYPIGKVVPDRKRNILRYCCISCLATPSKGNFVKNLIIFVVQKLLRMKANSCALRMVRHAKSQTGGKNVMLSADCNIKRPIVMKPEWFGEPVLHKFENTQYHIPQNYDDILKLCYGDYMKLPPEEQRVGHHDFSAYILE